MRNFLKFAALLIALLAATASAYVPPLVNFQGRLNDSGGGALTDTVSITFTIYNNSAGSGIAEWTETHPAVPVINGLFTVVLGTFTPLEEDVFNINTVVDRFLAISVNGGPVLQPLQRIAAVPYALRVATVDDATGGVIDGKLRVGTSNSNPGDAAFVVGSANSAAGLNSSVTGGTLNTASGENSHVGGGRMNVARGSLSFVGGGGAALGSDLDSNSALGDYSAVLGGQRNLASGYAAAVVGGSINRAEESFSFVGAGTLNSVESYGSFIGSGSSNNIDAAAVQSVIVGGNAQSISVGGGAFIGGGAFNQITGTYGSITGGTSNFSTGNHGSIGGGRGNRARGSNATIAGGGNFLSASDSNVALGNSSTIGGGGSHIAGGDYSTIPGGFDNSAGGKYAFAAGRGASAAHAGSFVWGDSTAAAFASTANNQFLVRASGGVGIGTNAPDAPIHVQEGSAGSVSGNANAAAVLERDNECWLHILSPDANQRGILFGSPSNAIMGSIRFSPPGTEKGYHFRCGNNSVRLVLDSLGNLSADGCVVGSNIACPSDARLKKNVVTLTDAMSQVEQLRGVRYEWRPDSDIEREFPEGQQIGLIAQEVMKIVPQAVIEGKDGYYAVDYSRLVPLLIQGMKEQQVQLDEQRKQIAALVKLMEQAVQ